MLPVRSATCSFLAVIVLMVFHAVSRAGFELPWSHYAAGLSLAALFNFLPLLLARDRMDNASVVSLWMLVTLLGTSVLGWCLMPFDVSGERALILLGSLVMLEAWRRFGTFRISKAVWMTAVILGLWYAVFFWSFSRGKYVPPLFLESMASGNAHLDTLFHGSLATMLQAHYIPGTGLDGVVFTPYHWGSHVCVAGWARFCGVVPVEFYSTLWQPLFLPLFFNALLHAAECLGRWMKKPSVAYSWSAAAVVLLLSQFHLAEAFQDLTQRARMSQSFALSMIWFAHLGIFSVHWLRRKRDWPSGLVISVLFVFGGWIKISTALMFAAAYAVAGWTLVGWRERRYWTYGIALGASLILAVAVGMNNKGEPNAAYWPASPESEVKLFPLLHYALLYWPWFVALLMILLLQKQNKIGAESSKSWWLVLTSTALIALIGELPGMLLSRPGTGFFARVTIQFLPILPATLVAIYACDFKAMAYSLWNLDGPRWPQVVVILVPLVCVVASVIEVVEKCTASMLHQQLAARRPYLKNEVFKEQVGMALAQTERWPLSELMNACRSDELKSSAKLSFFRSLLKAGRQPLGESKTECVYVARSNADFWSLLPPATIPYIIPALTRRCALHGLPDPACKPAYYGLSVYPHRFEELMPERAIQELENARTERCPPTVKRIMTLDPKGRLVSLNPSDK